MKSKKERMEICCNKGEESIEKIEYNLRINQKLKNAFHNNDKFNQKRDFIVFTNIILVFFPY